MESLHFEVRSFDSLTPGELYEILHLRIAVFVVEQTCIYQDLDGKDQQAMHIIGWHQGNIIAYARILAPGQQYPGHAAIGRVLTNTSFRGKGIGKQLMRFAIRTCQSTYPGPIKISAQQHLTGFYQSLGFTPAGQGYLEDGIPHIGMMYTGIDEGITP